MNNHQPFPKLLTWILFNIIIPLLPIILGIALIKLQTQLQQTNVLDSTEFFFLSFTVLAATTYDYFVSDVERKVNPLFAILLQLISRLILPILILASGTIFTAVYINKNIADIGLRKELLLEIAIRAAAGISALCVFLQVFILFSAGTQPVAKQTPP